MNVSLMFVTGIITIS